MNRQNILRQWFHAWLENNDRSIEHIFTDGIVYSECYGPEYHGIEQIKKWFAEWNKKGKVIEWTIKQMIQQDSILVAEWHFKCIYNDIEDEFDGVTIAEFDNDMRISKLSEFQSKTEHYFPYEEL